MAFSQQIDDAISRMFKQASFHHAPFHRHKVEHPLSLSPANFRLYLYSIARDPFLLIQHGLDPKSTPVLYL